jgi:hypothetical protein
LQPAAKRPPCPEYTANNYLQGQQWQSSSCVWSAESRRVPELLLFTSMLLQMLLQQHKDNTQHPINCM